MNLDKFLSLDSECHISAVDAQRLNEDLASRSVAEIPLNDRRQVTDYLLAAFEMESVEQAIRPALENLLSELQAPG